MKKHCTSLYSDNSWYKMKMDLDVTLLFNMPILKAWGRCLVLVFSLAHCPALAQSEWQLSQTKEGLQVWFRETNGSNIKELRIVTRINASLSTLTALINGVEHFPEWVYECKESSFLSKNSEQDFVYRNRANFPWPLNDREFIMHCVTWQDRNSLVVYSYSSAVPNFLPQKLGLARIESTQSNWILTPLTNGQVEVEYFLKTNPGGNIPAWAVNWALEIGPVKTFRKMKEMATQEPWRNKQLAWIKGP